MEDKLYGFFYCPCIDESVAALVSLHRTERGAEMAMEFHKAHELKSFEEWADESFTFGQFERWEIEEV